MPINYPGFNADPNIKNDFSGIGDILPNMLAGYQAGLIPQQMRMERHKQELANALAEQQTQNLKLTNQYFPQTTQADINYKIAQANKANLTTDPLYIMGKNLNGDPKNAFQLELMRKRAEVDKEFVPVYQAALKANDLDRRNKESQINSRDQLANTITQRYATPTGKLTLEQQDVQDGWMPGTGRTVPIPENKRAELIGRYGLANIKNVTDADTRQRNYYATNIEKTLEQIDPEILTSYSGFGGGIEEFGNMLASPFGGGTKNYDKYKDTVKAVKLLRDQVRSFYKGSIQPAYLDDLEELVNPSSWGNNPRQALSQFNTIKNILSSELQTYRDATQTPDVLTGKKSDETKNIQPINSPNDHLYSDEELLKAMGKKK